MRVTQQRIRFRFKKSVLLFSTTLTLAGAVYAQQTNPASFLEVGEHRLAIEQTNPRQDQAPSTPTQSQQQPFNGMHEQAPAVGALPNPNLAIAQPKRPNYPEEVQKQMYPLTSDEIRQIIADMVERQGAATVPSHVDMVGVSSQYSVDLSLGSAPPIVRVARGLGAMVNFVDAQGNPWPIVSATNFHFEAAKIEQVADHVLSVASLSPYYTGSVGVMLEGLSTPIQFMVVPATSERDYRVDLRIPQLSPNAKPFGDMRTKPALGESNIKDFLYGATPDGAKRLKVTGAGVELSNTRAWQNMDGKLVVRTSARIISPSWLESQPALDGTTVYVLNSTPVVRTSVDGKESMFYIEGLTPLAAKK